MFAGQSSDHAAARRHRRARRRCCATSPRIPDEIWRFSFFDLSIYRFFKESKNYRRASFHLLFFAGVLVAEGVRRGMARFLEKDVFLLAPPTSDLPQILVDLPGRHLHRLRPAENLEQHPQREEARGAGAAAGRSASGRAHQPDQSALPVQYPELRLVADPHGSEPGARHGGANSPRSCAACCANTRISARLRDELSFIEDYLSIEVVRFGDKLRFEKDVAEDTLDMLVPSMLLQPLVENSIKHGLSSKVEGGTIRIRAHRTESKLHLLVEDDGVGIPESKLATLLDRGIGVSNVNERLKVLFGNEYRMWIDSQPGSGTRIQIEAPELHTDLAAVS